MDDDPHLAAQEFDLIDDSGRNSRIPARECRYRVRRYLDDIDECDDVVEFAPFETLVRDCKRRPRGCDSIDNHAYCARILVPITPLTLGS